MTPPVFRSAPDRFGLVALLALVLALTLVGCTTIEDFRRLSPDQRAQRVCERDATVGAHNMRLGEWERQHAQTQAALDRGYHLHRQCRSVPAAVTEVCEMQGNRRVCRTREEERRRVCSDVPVPLDARLESDKLAAYAENIARERQARDQTWQRCVAHVRTLSPEAAFSLY